MGGNKVKTPFQKWQNGEHTAEIFLEMCKAHDVTFAHSDHFDVWKKGHEELKQISEAAITLGPAAKEIWNANVREKFHPDHAEAFLW
jgi:tRNA pseudouridine-54 N-methylase